MVQRMVVQNLTSYTACLSVRSVVSYCFELLAEGNSCVTLVDDLFLIDSYEIAWMSLYR